MYLKFQLNVEDLIWWKNSNDEPRLCCFTLTFSKCKNRKCENQKCKTFFWIRQSEAKKFLHFYTFDFFTLQNVRVKQHSPGTGSKTVARSIYKKALIAVQCTDKNQKLTYWANKKNSKCMELIGFLFATPTIIRKICIIFSWFTVKCCIFRSIELV